MDSPWGDIGLSLTGWMSLSERPNPEGLLVISSAETLLLSVLGPNRSAGSIRLTVSTLSLMARFGLLADLGQVPPTCGRRAKRWSVGLLAPEVGPTAFRPDSLELSDTGAASVVAKAGCLELVGTSSLDNVGCPTTAQAWVLANPWLPLARLCPGLGRPVGSGVVLPHEPLWVDRLADQHHARNYWPLIQVSRGHLLLCPHWIDWCWPCKLLITRAAICNYNKLVWSPQPIQPMSSSMNG